MKLQNWKNINKKKHLYIWSIWLFQPQQGGDTHTHTHTHTHTLGGPAVGVNLISIFQPVADLSLYNWMFTCRITGAEPGLICLMYHCYYRNYIICTFIRRLWSGTFCFSDDRWQTSLISDGCFISSGHMWCTRDSKYR